MKFSMKVLVMLTAAMFLTSGLAIAGPEKDPLKARVPADKRAKAKKNKSPYGKKSKDATPEIIAEGKAIFLGKGTCVNCHGKLTEMVMGQPGRCSIRDLGISPIANFTRNGKRANSCGSSKMAALARGWFHSFQPRSPKKKAGK